MNKLFFDIMLEIFISTVPPRIPRGSCTLIINLIFISDSDSCRFFLLHPAIMGNLHRPRRHSVPQSGAVGQLPPESGVLADILLDSRIIPAAIRWLLYPLSAGSEKERP
jgi:hypothetical protein